MPRSTSYLIYIVEDDADDRSILEWIFATHCQGCRVHFFLNGPELFIRLTHQLDGRLPDLIVLDIETPIMSGFETLQFLKSIRDYQRIPIIVRSGYDQIDCINQCYELGCLAFINKGNDRTQLAEMVQALSSGRYIH